MAATTATLRNALTTLAIAACAPAATAQDSGFYLGLALGKTGHGKEVTLSIAPDRALTGLAQSNAFSWQLDGGYRFNRYFSLEAGYIDFGSVTANVGDASGGAHVQFDAAGPTLALLGTFPIGRWEPYIKAGVLFSDTQLSYAGWTDGAAFRNTLDGSTEDLLFGIGVGYAINEQWQLKLDVTRADAGEKSTGQLGFSALSGGVTVRF